MTKKTVPETRPRAGDIDDHSEIADFDQLHEFEIYSAIACEKNKHHILSVISPIFSTVSSVLEIGSGTGQHAIFFSQKMPHLTWYTSDCQPFLDGINTWITDTGLPNVKPPFELDVSRSVWPNLDLDAVFTASSLHVMHLPDVVNFIKGAAGLLKQNGSLVVYGPFNYNGLYTSDSNKRFDQWLKEQDLLSYIKDFEDVVSLADDNGMELVTDYEMPDSNRILHFIKK